MRERKEKKDDEGDNMITYEIDYEEHLRNDQAILCRVGCKTLSSNPATARLSCLSGPPTFQTYSLPMLVAVQCAGAHCHTHMGGVYQG